MAQRGPTASIRHAPAGAACPLHPDGRTREFLADGDDGRGVYRFCLPPDGGMHALGRATPEAAPPREPRFRRAGADEDRAGTLSAPELDVLRQAARGLTVPETARVLGKGSETVKSQRNSVILKLGARNITHAACIGVERGFVVSG